MTHIRKILSATGIALVVASIGCGYRHGDLARNGTLRIETSPPTGSLFYGIYVEQSDIRFIVTGFGKRPTPYGRVEVEVVGPAGKMLDRTTAELLPPLPVRNRSYNYRFRAVLPFIPQDGSVIRVRYQEPDARGA